MQIPIHMRGLKRRNGNAPLTSANHLARTRGPQWAKGDVHLQMHLDMDDKSNPMNRMERRANR